MDVPKSTKIVRKVRQGSMKETHNSGLSKQHFDEVRRAWVAATPEEGVRQRVLKKMIHALGFPKELIAVEKELKELPHLAGRSVPERRIDVLCYGKEIHPEHSLYPLLLIECKREAIDEAEIGR